MKGLAKWLKNMPWILKLILVIFWGIYGNLERLVRSAARKNLLGMVLAILLLIFGGFVILWILDIITVLLGKKIWWID